jgi:ribosomal protein L24
MPQIAKGGKYIFGWSLVRDDGRIQIPGEAQEEYHLIPGENVILISGSKTTGGFIVSTKAAIHHSKLSIIFKDLPKLAEYQIPKGEAVKYKGRLYGWTCVIPGGSLKLSNTTLATFGVNHGDRLLVIRGSHMGFAMGVKGPIIEAARQHPEIVVF